MWALSNDNHQLFQFSLCDNCRKVFISGHKKIGFCQFSITLNEYIDSSCVCFSIVVLNSALSQHSKYNVGWLFSCNLTTQPSSFIQSWDWHCKSANSGGLLQNSS